MIRVGWSRFTMYDDIDNFNMGEDDIAMEIPPQTPLTPLEGDEAYARLVAF